MDIEFIKTARLHFTQLKTALAEEDPQTGVPLRALEQHLYSVELPPDERYAVAQAAGGQWRILVYDGNRWRNHSDELFSTAATAAANIPDAGQDIPQWAQPEGAHDAYAKDAEVLYGGLVWVSTVDANVWEPGVYGWLQQ